MRSIEWRTSFPATLNDP